MQSSRPESAKMQAQPALKTPTGKRKAEDVASADNPFEQILQSSAVKSIRKEPVNNIYRPVLSFLDENIAKDRVDDNTALQVEEKMDLVDKENSLLNATRIQSPVINIHTDTMLLDDNRRYSLGVSRYSSCSPMRTSRRSSQLKRLSKPKAEAASSSCDPNEKNTVQVATNIGQKRPAKKNFIEYVSVGVDQCILKGTEKPQKSYLQRTEVQDVFPARDKPLINSIAEFCFPNGASLRLMDVDVAIARCSETCDKSHILQFSDSAGTPKFAYCLVIAEYFETTNQQLVSELAQLEQFINAARVIRFFFSSR